MYKGQTITVIMPCLNEEQGVEQVLTRMPEFVDQVLVVDNGSTDRTSEVAARYGAQVIREDARGYGRSYKTGLAAACGDIIITLDGDHSYPPDAISYLLEAFIHLKVDFLNASRFPVRDGSAMSFKHWVGNLILSLAMSILYLTWVRDSQSGMWVFHRSILSKMKLESDGMAFSEEIKIEALKLNRHRFAELSILYSSRLGEIKLNPWRDGAYNLWFLLKETVLMKVAAVVPHWNRRDLLQTLLANLGEQTRPFDEIIVVDNGSTDDSAALAERAGAKVVRLERNLGFAAAVNRGIEAACNQANAADWIAILNNDVTLAPDWLTTLLAAAENERAWFATGKTLSANDRNRIDGTFDAISLGGCACRCGSGKPDGPFWNQLRRIRMGPMTAALFQRRLFEEIGSLDEGFESYLEDVDFGIRCAIHERWGVYVPTAIAYHQGSSTWGQWNKYSVRLIARNQLLLTAKHFGGLSRWPVVAGQLLWGVVALCHGCAGAYLQGKMAGMRVARSIPAQRPASESFKAFVRESEKTVLEVQRQTGFDRYWRAYFWLRGL